MTTEQIIYITNTSPVGSSLWTQAGKHLAAIQQMQQEKVKKIK